MRLTKFFSTVNPFSTRRRRKRHKTRRQKKNIRHTKRRIMRGG